MQKPSENLPVSESKWLTSEDFQYLCFDLAKELLSYGEPIPDYSTRDNSLLESALGAPRQTFGQTLLYPNLAKQSAVLFYSLIKNHPFKNGNKRIAVMGLLAFLSLNSKWMQMKPIELYELACQVSESIPDDRDQVLKLVENQVDQNLIAFPIQKI